VFSRLAFGVSAVEWVVSGGNVSNVSPNTRTGVTQNRGLCNCSSANIMSEAVSLNDPPFFISLEMKGIR